MNKKSLIILILCLSIGVVSSPLKVLPLPVSAQESVQVTAEVLYNNLNVRAQPNVYSEILGQFDMGTVVNVTGRVDRSYVDGIWVYVTEPLTQLTGWVSIEYIEFSVGNWADFVPILTRQEILYPEGTDVPLRAKVINANLRVRVEADDSSEVIGTLPIGSLVSILGRHLDIYVWGVYLRSSYIYIEQVDGTLSGWVSDNYLQLTDGTPVWSIMWKLPVIEVKEVSITVVQVEGQIIGAVDSERGLHLRTEPSTNAEILMTIYYKNVVAVYGRTNGDRVNRDTWVFVKVLETGQMGWVLAWPIYYPYRFNENTLPVLSPTNAPDLPPSAQPISALAGITKRTTPLRLTPYILGQSNEIRKLPPNTPITVIGRNFTMDWFKVVVDGQEGWVRFSYITVEGDTLRLPITLLNGGYRLGYFD